MLILSASPRWRWCPGVYFAGFIQNLMLYETSKYSPGHQRHLGEANETDINDPPFDEVSAPLSHFLVSHRTNSIEIEY